MATLQELMAECFGESAADAASALTKKASADTSEIDEVLANLGLDGTEAVKVASSAADNVTKETGGNMGLMDIYEEIMDGTPNQSAQVEGNESASSQMGELVGEYFNVMVGPYFEKVAGEEGEEPMGDLDDAAEEMPHMEVNHKPELGKSVQTATGGKSSYSLKDQALAKQILKRLQAGQVGNYKVTE